MAFKPINDDHSIQAVAFTIALTKPIRLTTVVDLQTRPALWRSELPAMEVQQFFELPNTPQVGQARGTARFGIDFSRKRPDGTSAWALRFLGENISVETAAYSRWVPVWTKARVYLAEACQRLAALEPDLEIKTVGLWMVDLFTSEGEATDFSALFAPSVEIASVLPSRGANWHSHTGWFNDSTLGRCLQNLNVDCLYQARADYVAPSPERETSAKITHTQVTTLARSLPLSGIDIAKIEPELAAMHDNNKHLLRSVLAPGMQKTIGLIEQ